MIELNKKNGEYKMPLDDGTTLDNPDQAETPLEDAAASSSEETEETDEQNEDGKKVDGKKVDGKTKRISKLSFKNRELQRRLQEAEAKLVTKQESEKVDTTPKAPDAEAPKPEDFETDREFLRAAAKYDLKVELAKIEAKRSTTAEAAQATSEATKTREAFEARIDAGFETYGDEFADAIENPINTQSMVKHIGLSERTADIAMYLLKNPKIAEEMAEMSDKEVERKVWHLETITLPKPSSKVRTDAPKPPSDIKSTKSPARTKDFSKVSGNDYRRQQEKKRKDAAAAR